MFTTVADALTYVALSGGSAAFGLPQGTEGELAEFMFYWRSPVMPVGECVEYFKQVKNLC